jgi:hypothetical protein
MPPAQPLFAFDLLLLSRIGLEQQFIQGVGLHEVIVAPKRLSSS